MNTNVGFDTCFTFVHGMTGEAPATQTTGPMATHHFITISRQGGCGAHAITHKLRDILQARTPANQRPWTVFDKNLVERVMEDHQLPKQMEKYLREDCISEIGDIMDNLFGLHPSSWTLVQKTSETILRLANLGNCIIIGRAANIVTDKLDHGLHVRLVGSLDKRIQRMMKFENMDHDTAEETLDKQDHGRIRHLKKYFNKDLNDPMLYDMFINTDHFSDEDVARLIEAALYKRLGTENGATND